MIFIASDEGGASRRDPACFGRHGTSVSSSSSRFTVDESEVLSNAADISVSVLASGLISTVELKLTLLAKCCSFSCKELRRLFVSSTCF